MANPGGLNLNISPYFDDYDEDKKFARVLFVPGRAVQARELTQMQTYQQKQIQRFAEYFFRQGAIVDGCEPNLDLRMEYVKLQTGFDGVEVNTNNFLEKRVVGANTGVEAYVGLATDVSGNDPKTLFINYKSAGALRLTTTSFGSTAITVGNTLNFLNTTDGNSANAIITAFVQDPITDEFYIYCNSLFGSPNTAAASIGATTIDGSGANVTITITDFLDKRSSTRFEESELLFTRVRTPALLANASYANTSTVRATTFVENEGTANEVVYQFGSKYTLGSGIIYLADHFVKHDTQTIILDKYKNTPSYKIGVVPQKDFIDTVDDQSLLDNAQGTPNFQALGADRLKINTVLTKIPLNTSTDETEFVSVAEVENGLIKKRPQLDVDSNLERAIANRTFEESGNYTVSDPKVFIREHLNQAGNGGKFTAAEGGNNELLIIETDPFVSYVKGYRNALLTKEFTPLRKGTDTQYIEQTKTTIVVGSFVPVKEMVGSWDYMESTRVDLYDTPQQAISNGSFSSTTLQGTKIGEARIRVVEYASGTPGHADAVYNLYLFDIAMVPGKFFQDVRSVYDSVAGLPDRFADIVVNASGDAALRDSAFEPSIFKLPYGGIKTIRDDQNDIESEFQFRKEFQVFFNQAGIITLVTTDLNETFTSGDTTSLSNINYLVVPTITANTASLSGTANVVSGNDYVFGTGTDFEDRFLAGDVIRVGTQDRIIEEIISDTVLVVTNNWSANASIENYSKVIPAGVPVRLSGIGTLGPAEEREVTVGAIPQTVEIDLKEDTLISSAGAGFTARVTATMNRANAREMRKILANNVTTIINANTHPNELIGPYGLGYGDIYQVRSIWQSDSFDNPPVAGAASNTNVTSSYTLDNGQRDTSYEHGAIIPKVGVVPSGRLLVTFDHFTHDTSQGIGYLSVDSYPINDVTTSNTTIRTEQIPVYTSTRTGTEYNLRDCIDFRPIRTANTSAINPLSTISTIITGSANVESGNATVIGTGTTFEISLANNDIIRIANQERRVETIVSNTELTTSTAFTVTANNEGVFRVTSGTFRIPGGGLHFPVPASDYTADLIFYKGRKAKLYVDETGALGISDGSPGYPFSFPPPTIPDTLEIAEISIPVYPSLTKDIRIESFKNRRFTMQDIGKIKGRVEQLEYYAKLNEIERQASQKLILDSDGVDKFKNGVLVDTFDGHNVGDVRNPDYKVTIDRTYRYASSYANNGIAMALKYNSSDTDNTGVVKTSGNKIILAFEEQTYIDQPFASQTINLAQELTFTWNGNLTLVPATDNWIDLSYPAEANSVVNLTGFTDNIREIVDWFNTEVSPITRFWVGEEPVTTVTDVGNAFNSRVRAQGGGLQVQQAQRTLTTSEQELFETRGTIDVELEERNSVTERVADVSVRTRIRPRDFVFGSTGMKDGARLYAFFDDVDVTANCTQIRLVGNTTIDDLDELYDNDGNLATDDTKYIRLNTGDLRVSAKKIFGIFKVPENRFYTGQRNFRLTDDPLNRVTQATTIAETSIFAQGLAVTKGYDIVNTRPFNFAGFANQRVEGPAGERTAVISDTTANIQVGVWDPLSQSFYVDENVHPQGIYVTSLDLYFSSKSEDVDEGVTVELREMLNGFPTRRVIGNEVARRENSEINTSTNGTSATTFTFKNPIYLPPATEFCFVAKPDGNSTGFNVFVAELGQFDITNTEISLRIEKQAAAGVLFTSSNDLTWSARQNQDVKFKMRIARFETSGVVVFNNMLYNGSTNFNYNAYTVNMEQLKLPKTEINMEVRVANEEYDIISYKPIRNLERIVETGVRTIANTSNENTELPTERSFSIRATLTTENRDISPYIDLERMNVALEQTIINNATQFQLEGTAAWSANTVVVTGSGTDFLNELSVGEFVLFGEEYRQVAKISNSTYLEVRNRFNTSSAGSVLFSKNEENPTGPYASLSRYISRAVELNDGFESSDIVVYLATNKQQGTSIKVYYKVLAAADTDSFDSKFWEEMVIDSTSTTNQNSVTYNEEKYVVPASKKTGGSQLLAGSVATTSGSADVVGTGTAFFEDLTIGSQIAIGTGRILRTITAISNNTFLTVDSNYSTTTSGEEVYKILNNEIGYTTPDGRSFSGFKYYAIKVVFLSTNPAYAPKIKNLRAIALA
jgi:hypothetical protein